MAFTLSVDKTEILIGDTLNFTLDKGSAGAWAEVLFHYVLPNVTHLNSYWTSPLIQFTPTLIGEWEFYYEKDGETSNTVTVTVRNPVYTLELDESDYYTPNGNVTANTTLKCEGSAVSGATISLTGTGSTLTATTNSSGVATFNITGLQDKATITATYNNSVTDTATIHYFDNTTLLGSLYLLGDKIATNLATMGVTGFTYLDGLSTLADEILNLPPAMGGIEVVTALSISASPSVVAAGETVTITGVLEADKDDTSQVNVDLEGYLSGATVKIYNESTLLGSAVTNSNGVYSFQYTPSSHGSLTLHAAFEGTNDYDACQSSNVNVSVVDAVPAVLNLTSDKDILSYADEQQTPGSQVATLSAEVLDTLGDPSENVPVQFYKDGVSWGDPVYTNSNGIATKSYTSQGVGNIEFGAECGSLVSETYDVHDYWWVFDNDLTKFNTNNFYLGNESFICASSNTDYALLNTPITLPNEFEIDYTMKKTGSSSNWTFLAIGESGNGQTVGSANEIHYDIGKLNSSSMHIRNDEILQIDATTSDNASNNTNYPTKITYQNGTLSLTYNNLSISITNPTIDLTYLLGIGIGWNGMMRELIIKKL